MSPIGTRAILLCAAVLTAVVSLPRVKVDGPSMAPTLTAGDRLVVLPGVVTAGALVVARDPREPTRLLVKRATKVDRDGLVLRGDNPAASTDSRHFGPVPRRLLVGRPVYRYSPPESAGWLWTS